MVAIEHHHNTESTVMCCTHFSFTSHSLLIHFSYFHCLTLREHEYEVIDESAQDYNLQCHPSSALPHGRGATYTVESFKEISSMNTGTEVISPAIRTPCHPNTISMDYDFMNTELEQKPLGYDTPSSTGTPQSNEAENVRQTDFTSLASACLGTQEKKTTMQQGIVTSDDSNSSEEFISPIVITLPLGSAQCSKIQLGGLKNIPETGDVFSEKLHPTPFPVYDYEDITSDPEPEMQTTGKGKLTSLSLLPSLKDTSGRTDCGVHYEAELTQSFKDGANHCIELTPQTYYGDSNSEADSSIYGPQTVLSGSSYVSTCINPFQQDRKDIEYLGDSFLDKANTVPSADGKKSQGIDISTTIKILPDQLIGTGEEV